MSDRVAASFDGGLVDSDATAMTPSSRSGLGGSGARVFVAAADQLDYALSGLVCGVFDPNQKESCSFTNETTKSLLSKYGV
jgi:hypothetical protein